MSNNLTLKSDGYILTPEEDQQMDVISNAIIDLILSNPCKYLKTIVKSNKLNIDRKKEFK